MLSCLKFFSPKKAPQTAGYGALEDAPVPTVTLPATAMTTLRSIYNQLKAQHEASYAQKFFGRRAGDRGYCRTWAKKDALAVVAAGALGYAAKPLIAASNEISNAGTVSLWSYNHQPQNNNLTCSSMFDRPQDYGQNCDGPIEGAIGQFCRMGLDYQTNYSEYIRQCSDTLNDCCRAGDDGLSFGAACLILVGVVILVGRMYWHHEQAAKNSVLSLTAEQSAILSQVGITVEHRDTQLSLMAKIESLIQIDAGISESVKGMPFSVLGIINGYYGDGTVTTRAKSTEGDVSLSNVGNDGSETPLMRVV